MKPVETLAEYLGFMLALDAKSLPRVHAPEALFQHAANLVASQRGVAQPLLLHPQHIAIGGSYPWLSIPGTGFGATHIGLIPEETAQRTGYTATRRCLACRGFALLRLFCFRWWLRKPGSIAEQRDIHLPIKLIRIGKGGNLASIVHDGREIGHVHREFPIDGDRIVYALVPQVFDLTRSPSFILAKEDLGEPLRVLHANAFMADHPHGLFEELFPEWHRVVHVNGVLVRKQEFYLAEDVIRPS